jgi:hypothetical protein
MMAKLYYDKHIKADQPKAEIGEYVYAKPSPHHRGEAWRYGKVIDTPTPRSYTVATSKGNFRRNRRQLRLAAPPPCSDPPKLSLPTHNPVRGVMHSPVIGLDQPETLNPVSTNGDPKDGPQVIRTPGRSQNKAVVMSPRIQPAFEPYVTRYGRVVKQKLPYDC